MKADQWRILWTIYIPLALLSLWMQGLPTTSQNAELMGVVLENAMALVSLVTTACKHSMTQLRMDSYRENTRHYLDTLKKVYPGFIIPSHHMIFHIYDFLERFGPIRAWWCFPFERLIGRLQKLPHNHKQGVLIRMFLLCITELLIYISRRTGADDGSILDQRE